MLWTHFTFFCEASGLSNHNCRSAMFVYQMVTNFTADQVIAVTTALTYAIVRDNMAVLSKTFAATTDRSDQHLFLIWTRYHLSRTNSFLKFPVAIVKLQASCAISSCWNIQYLLSRYLHFLVQDFKIEWNWLSWQFLSVLQNVNWLLTISSLFQFPSRNTDWKKRSISGSSQYMH